MSATRAPGTPRLLARPTQSMSGWPRSGGERWPKPNRAAHIGEPIMRRRRLGRREKATAGRHRLVGDDRVLRQERTDRRAERARRDRTRTQEGPLAVDDRRWNLPRADRLAQHFQCSDLVFIGPRQDVALAIFRVEFAWLIG